MYLCVNFQIQVLYIESVCVNSITQTSKNSHIVAVSDEDGYISLYNTRFKLMSSSTYQENAGKINSLNLFQNFDSI